MQNNIFNSQSYGGIEIKENARKNTFIGFIYSVALHALLILIYVGWTWINSDDKRPISIHGTPITLIDISPPPLTSHDFPLPPLVAPKSDAEMPKFGIPIPVPDIQAPNEIIPYNNLSIPGNQNTMPGGSTIGTPEATNTIAPQPKVVAPDKPNRDIFISVDEDPKPILDVQSLVQYPDQAKRSNLEGKVSYSALIGIDGRVKEVLIDKSDYDVFRQAVIDALMNTRFTPARVDQNPVEVYYSGTIIFKLNGR